MIGPGTLPSPMAAPLMDATGQMQRLVELEVNYRWFRTCKDAEVSLLRKKGAEAKRYNPD